jgi:four helix bundle protein
MAKANRGYEDLQVWQKAIDLAHNIYVATKAFPKEELYGLTSQMRRSSVSIASNIAEGYARNSAKEFAQFLAIACGSTAELKTQLIISGRIALTAEPMLDKLLSEATAIERMLSSLAKSIIKPASCTLQLAT